MCVMMSTSCSFLTAKGMFFMTIAVGISSSSGSVAYCSWRSWDPPRLGGPPKPENALVADSCCGSSQPYNSRGQFLVSPIVELDTNLRERTSTSGPTFHPCCPTKSREMIVPKCAGVPGLRAMVLVSVAPIGHRRDHPVAVESHALVFLIIYIIRHGTISIELARWLPMECLRLVTMGTG